MLSQAFVQTPTGVSSIGQTTVQRNVVHCVAHTLNVMRPVFLDARMLLGIVIVHFLAKVAELARSRADESHACLANNLLECMAHTMYVKGDRNFRSFLRPVFSRCSPQYYAPTGSSKSPSTPFTFSVQQFLIPVSP